jgi:hypothetical protein
VRPQSLAPLMFALAIQTKTAVLFVDDCHGERAAVAQRKPSIFARVTVVAAESDEALASAWVSA